MLSALLSSLVLPVYLLLRAYGWLILAAFVLSWLRALNALNPYSPAVRSICRFVDSATEPYLKIFRRFIPPAGMLDLSAMVAWLMLIFLQGFVPALLNNLAAALA